MANSLRDLNREEFLDELAERWGELNVVHSFSEGNTRAQFVFFSELSKQAGYQLDTSAFQVGHHLHKAFVDARFHRQTTGSNTRLAGVLAEIITSA